MEQYFILEGCRLEGISDYFAAHLSASIEDYPYGIVIPIEKPYRWTSADVVRKVKFQLQKHFHLKNLKVGHAGTLDPLATGLLVICAGKATKISEELQSHEKEYVAEIEFGATTPSYDLEQGINQFFPYTHITREKVAAVLRQFIGEQEQVPPLFSAKMVGGIRAYEYARAGEPIELKTSVITIYEIELLSFTPGMDVEQQITTAIPAAAQNGNSAEANNRTDYLYQRSEEGGKSLESPRPRAVIRIKCSKGTYIRSLARDLGLALESGAYLTSLKRTASGIFKLSE